METKIKEIITELSGREITDEKINLLADGYLDSFAIVNLIAAIEDKFGITVAAEDILPQNFATVEDIAALIERSEKN